MADTHDMPRSEWKSYFERMTKAHDGGTVTIEVLDMDFGDGLEAEGMPFIYIEYDPKDDDLVVAAGARDGRFPVALRHIVEHPQRILVDRIDGAGDEEDAIGVVGQDGSPTIVTIRS
ncbi:MAG: hypothetical protein JWM12_1076 [Ilumatobacteraceae bacterium]|jgi:hypothetical protein|nr:hypothetical protein [Ilumatobacteraceae bacterium]